MVNNIEFFFSFYEEYVIFSLLCVKIEEKVNFKMYFIKKIITKQ